MQMGMFRLKHLIIAATLSLAAVCCTEKDDDRVNREILVSTVWLGERFGESSVEAEEGAMYLYVFGSDGIMSLFPESAGTEGVAAEELRYIYTPSADEMVIERYGNFAVREISVDRLCLEGSSGVLDLVFWGGEEALPAKGAGM